VQKKDSAVIGIPLLCVNAEDDPIVPASCVPFDVVDKHSNVISLGNFTEFTVSHFHEGRDRDD